MWEKAKRIASEISLNLSSPRAATRSRYRSNAGVDTEDGDDAEAYYRRNVYFPFIDHCIEEFEQRFPSSQNSLFLGYKLLPYNVLQIKDEEIQKLEDFYGNDLPNKPTFKAEVCPSYGSP